MKYKGKREKDTKITRNKTIKIKNIYSNSINIIPINKILF